MNALQIKEIKGISYDGEVIFATCYDDYFIYADNANKIHTFDSKSYTNSILPPPDRKIKGNVVTVCCSPSRKFGAAGYSDGGLQLYDLESNKSLKLIVKPHNAAICKVLFYSDGFLLSIDSDGLLLMHKISLTIGIVSSRETQIAKLSKCVFGLFQPRIYRYVEGKERSARTILSNFTELIGISTVDSFSLVNLKKEELTLKTIKKIDVGGLFPVFYTVDSRNLLIAVAYPDKVEIYSLSSTFECELKGTIQVSLVLIFLTFLSSNILIGFNKERSYLMLSLDEFTAVEIESPINGFASLNDVNPVFFTACKLWEVTLQPFTTSMELFCETNNAEDAIEFCKKAIAGDALATVGLSSNPGQRALVIERSISKLLTGYLSGKLKADPKNSRQIASYFIDLNIKLRMQEWLVNEAAPIFQENNELVVFIQEIIKADPNASIFTYTHSFTELILENHGEIDISNFIMSLPNKVAPPIELIQYAQKIGDNILLSSIYINSLNDITNGLQILGNANMYNDVCKAILNHTERAAECILWIFTLFKGRFPHIENILKCSQAFEVFSFVESQLELNQSPITFHDYVNAMIQALCAIPVPHDDPFLCMMQHYVLNKKIKLLAGTLKCLVSLIFNKEATNKKDLEQLLIYILSSDVPGQFKESLLQLCDSFGYEEAKRRIQEDAKKYENTIKECFIDLSQDVFLVINNIMEKDPNSKPSIRKALFTFAPIFIAKNVSRFSTLVINEFPDAAIGIIREVQEENSRCIFIHHLLQSPKMQDLKLQSDMFVKYVTFLCKYYPSEVCGYIKTMKDEPLTNLIEVCKRYSIFDALALIYDLTNDFSKCTDYLIRFEQTQLVLFAEGKTSTQDVTIVTSFILEFVESIIKKRSTSEETRRMCKKLINGMVLPLYCLQKNNCIEDDRVNILTDFLRRICELVANIITFPVLIEQLVVNFQELHFGLAKSAIINIMHDYSYDVDTTNAMCQLYRLDEVNEHAKYVKGKINGLTNHHLTCCTCHHRIMGVDGQIQIFPCGHIFHKNPQCLPKQVCPVCNPTERLDQDIAPPTQTMPQNRFRSQLRKFEFMLNKRNALADRKENFDIKKDQIMIVPIAEIPC
ncbi:hypothetical protein TRFO_28309 [Tritrichomonas foetus]|uniref:RING-type domain-containing protein n=1 Tax=Tritrichomonas foetus TaxID=1144522 RepID=A0A1J4JYM7_9EUKA|nr:hypothetical protein TRFO_28309 [Tritrichomonas foetus]|eukprot:OHT04257.1 hypothetical protein TRFO_28309 [Tritrichomonas foetus]